MKFLLVFLFIISATASVQAALDDILERYELVQSIKSRKIVKRGAADGHSYNRIEEFEFFAFDRNFRLVLTPRRGLFDSKFKTILVDGSNRNRPVNYVNIDPNEFMEGHVFGEKSRSKVTANIDEYGALSALIILDDETYTVEPAWRFLKNTPMSESIIYRHSDLIGERSGIPATLLACPAYAPGQPLDDFPPPLFPPFDDVSTKNLSKRQAFGPLPLPQQQSDAHRTRTGEKNRCSLKLVADYRFFENIGRKKASLTSRYLINLIDRVNTIYTNTIWRDNEQQTGITNYGFVIKKILIHSSPSNQSEHYNSNTSDSMSVEKLLLKFSQVEGSKHYCLVHLFTYQSFANGVLGLGYIAGAKEGSSGGICSAPMIEQGRAMYYNTALSSARSSLGGPVVTREADIVTAHEFGHNWGSPHDPSSLECSPASKSGGSYIMYTYSVSGYDENNKRFSPCSRRTIKGVLEAKAHLCFQEEEVSFCGNQRVEPGEECDEGLLDGDEGGRCCTMDCKFKTHAKCSPKNSMCCTSGCQYEYAGTTCREADRNRCRQDARCNGTSPECPPSPPMLDGTDCLDMGECQNGTCVSFCERRTIGQKPCICENTTLTCFRCCRRTNESECIPYMANPYSRPVIVSDGTRCIHGYCYKGDCVHKAADFVQHLWRIIDKLDINSFWKFLCDNVVGTIIIASLIVWIPASCLVHKWDERTRKDYQSNLDFIVSNYLVGAGDSDRVTIVPGVRSITGGYRGENNVSPPGVAV